MIRVKIASNTSILMKCFSYFSLAIAITASFSINSIALAVIFTQSSSSDLKLPKPSVCKVLAGPYVQNVTPTSATLMWLTDVPSIGEISISRENSFKTTSACRVGEVILENLKPATTYSYSLSVTPWGSRSHHSFSGPEYVFKTFPVEPRPISFTIYGDTRSHTERHAAVINAMSKEHPDFVLHTGDLVANRPNISLWLKEFFGPAAPLMRSVPSFTVLGNHEGNSRNYFDLLALPMRERYYSFEILNCHIIALDSCTDFDEGSDQYHWLIADLEKNKNAKCKFIFMHHPTYSSGSHGALGSSGLPRELPIRIAQKLLPPLASKYGIAAIFSGHNHLYERGHRDGTEYIVTSGGGAPLMEKMMRTRIHTDRCFSPTSVIAWANSMETKPRRP